MGKVQRFESILDDDVRRIRGRRGLRGRENEEKEKCCGEEEKKKATFINFYCRHFRLCLFGRRRSVVDGLQGVSE